ncbi:MAG: endolytic transglycosylase MltG [Calditrichaceae bacterium]
MGINFFKRLSNKQKSLILILFLLPIFVIDVLNYFTLPEGVYAPPDKIEINIPRGAALSQIADSLSKYELVKNKKMFIFWARVLGYENKLKAGLFKIPVNLNNAQLLTYLSQARAQEISVTILEGWNTARIAQELEQKLNINAVKFDSLCRDSSYTEELGIGESTLDGYLLPDTYSFYWGISEKSLIHFFVNKTLSLFESDTVKSAIKKLGMTRHQILTLASIVEGEAIFDDERSIIASVYYNRLRRHMKLQADPTVQFIVDDAPRRLLYRDLEIDSPYNTYLYYGLPPGPINNPGKASILASLFPADTKYLFFVATGDGRHAFSVTASEHARAKAAFDKVRREVYRKKRQEKLKEND